MLLAFKTCFQYVQETSPWHVSFMPLFHTDHQSPESSRIDKCHDSAGFVENCKIFNQFRDVLRSRYKTRKTLSVTNQESP